MDSKETPNHKFSQKIFSRRSFFKLLSLLATNQFIQSLLSFKAKAGGFIPFSFYKKKSTAGTTYVEDVFSTFIYSGTGASQTISNGLDLSGKGGMIWIKNRNATSNHMIFDSSRSNFGSYLSSNLQTAQTGNIAISGVSSSGFTLTAGDASTNATSNNYVAWSFRKATKFFDIQTYAGDGTTNRILTHNLGVAPGMIIIKTTSSSQSWITYHVGIAGNTYYDYINDNDVFYNSGSTIWTNTSTTFRIPNEMSYNTNGVSYVVYLFAHDTATDGMIQCGSYTGNSSTNTPINLGWEPQFVMIKKALDPAANGASPWLMIDHMRGFGPTYDNALSPYTVNAEAGDVSIASGVVLTPTGFQLLNANGAMNINTDTYVYMAIRRPNKPPTSASQVFYVSAPAGGQSTEPAPFPVDLAITFDRTSGYPTFNSFFDRLRGNCNYLTPNSNNALETNNGNGVFFNTIQNGYTTGSWFTLGSVRYSFKRAPGFFDTVCYTGDGVDAVGGRSIKHNLGVKPELIFFKSRAGGDGTVYWRVWYKAFPGATAEYGRMWIGLSSAASLSENITTVTHSQITFNNWYSNSSGTTFVAHIFASVAGISKIGTYTGSASASVAVDCGFTGTARFVIIKRTDASGDWYVVDSVRGSSYYVLLNSATTEVNTSVLTFTTGGFTTTGPGTVTNATGTAKYLYYAIA